MRFVGLLAGLALMVPLVGACSDDDPETSTPAPASSAPASSNGDGTTLVISVTGGDATTDELAGTVEIIERRMQVLGVGGTAAVTSAAGGSTITIEITDDAGLSSDDMVAQLTDSGLVLLRPVLRCVDEGSPPSATVDRTSTDPTATLTLPLALGGECDLGPARATGDVFEPGSAQPQIIAGGWGVAARVRDGADGLDLWNAVAASCFEATTTCPSSRLAIEVDGLIVSAPTVSSPSFGNDVQISGAFSEPEAAALALSINTGALPLDLEVTSVTTS